MTPAPEGRHLLVRRADVGDARTVTALVEAAYAPYLERMTRRPAPMDVDHRALICEADVEVWVTEDADGGAIVGVLVVRVKSDHVAVENVAVHPDAQGCGVGVRLLELVDEIASAAGSYEIRLYTNVVMTENLSFYARRGYERTHTRVDDGFERVHFVRRRG